MLPPPTLVHIWLVLEELLSELLVWVSLDGQCFPDSEDLEQEGELV